MKLSLMAHIFTVFLCCFLCSCLVLSAESGEPDCYSEVFEPSEEWRPVREGQELPAGLHIRVNLETGLREAKLMKNGDSESGAGDIGGLVQVLDSDPSPETEPQMESVLSERGGKPLATSSLDGAAVINALNTLVTWSTQPTVRLPEVDEALNTLIDLSHDSEYGGVITEPKYLKAMFELLESGIDTPYKEKILRIIGASLRNNPKAFANSFKINSVATLLRLIQDCDPDITTRYLYALTAAIPSTDLEALNEFKLNHGGQLMKSLFTHGDEAIRTKIINFLVDRFNMDSSILTYIDTSVNKGESSEPTEKDRTESAKWWFSNLQKEFLDVNTDNASSGRNIGYRKALFDLLSMIKQKYKKSMKVEDAFLSRLAELSESIRDSKTRNELNDEELEFRKQIREARHLTFGNPLAWRKEFDDDL